VPTPPRDRHWLVARDKPALLSQMMRFLAGDAHISFEGDLSKCDFAVSIPRLPEEQSILRRHTSIPKQDFLILALEHQTIRPILDSILTEDRYMKDIIHIQIEKRGELQFGSYDQFHHECIVCFLGVPTKFLDDLKHKRIIASWAAPSEGAVRWHG
jgi:hypothetical protein